MARTMDMSTKKNIICTEATRDGVDEAPTLQVVWKSILHRIHTAYVNSQRLKTGQTKPIYLETYTLMFLKSKRMINTKFRRVASYR